MNGKVTNINRGRSRKPAAEQSMKSFSTSPTLDHGLGPIFSRKFTVAGRKDDWDLLDHRRRGSESESDNPSAQSSAQDLCLTDFHDGANLSIDIEQMLPLLPLKLMVWAAATGDDAALAFLLSSIRLASSVFNYAGQSLLSIAAERGHARVVKLLLAQDAIDMNLPDLDGQTPLAWAAFNGHSDVIDLLLEHDELQAGTIDINGNTALAWAAANGHLKAVASLLERFDIAIDPVNHRGQTPRQLAAENGHLGIVHLFSRVWELSEN